MNKSTATAIQNNKQINASQKSTIHFNRFLMKSKMKMMKMIQQRTSDIIFLYDYWIKLSQYLNFEISIFISSHCFLNSWFLSIIRLISILHFFIYSMCFAWSLSNLHGRFLLNRSLASSGFLCRRLMWQL